MNVDTAKTYISYMQDKVNQAENWIKQTRIIIDQMQEAIFDHEDLEFCKK